MQVKEIKNDGLSMHSMFGYYVQDAMIRRMQPRQDSDVGTDLVASASRGNITNHNADATQNRHPTLRPTKNCSNTNHDANATATLTPATAEHPHPHNNNRGQPRVAQKRRRRPWEMRQQTINRGGGGARTPPSRQLGATCMVYHRRAS